MDDRLILVRHAAPQIAVGTPASLWRLSAEGRAAAATLGVRLAALRPQVIWSSPEPKALGTAQALAASLEPPIREDDRLREHDRGSLGYLSRTDLEAGVARLLTSHDAPVFGDETALAVFERLDSALTDARVAAAGGVAIAVTHGTAMAIYLGRRCGIDPLAFWRGLGLPCAIVLSGDRIEQRYP
jgi:broad specificity phosphatase PhoE